MTRTRISRLIMFPALRLLIRQAVNKYLRAFRDFGILGGFNPVLSSQS
jgi:hypothetical protein